MDKCKNCPVEGVCRAQTTGHARYCQLVDPEHPDHDPRYIQSLLLQPPERIGVGAPTRGSSRWRELQELVLECDYRGPLVGCGCNQLRTCWAGKGHNGQASQSECLNCVKAD